MSTYKHRESAAYIDKNGDLIFTNLGQKQNALCVKDRSSINSHAIAEHYRPQILCNRQCAKCNITFVSSGSSTDYWIITTCGVKHYFDRLYVWQDGEYKIQVNMTRAATQKELDEEREERERMWELARRNAEQIEQPINPLAPAPAPRPPEEGGWDSFGRDVPGSFLLGKE